jgi:hypothetical protein
MDPCWEKWTKSRQDVVRTSKQGRCAIHKIKVILFSVSRGVINYYILVASPIVYFVVTHYIGYCTCAMLIVGGVRRGEPK